MLNEYTVTVERVAYVSYSVEAESPEDAARLLKKMLTEDKYEPRIDMASIDCAGTNFSQVVVEDEDGAEYFFNLKRG